MLIDYLKLSRIYYYFGFVFFEMLERSINCALKMAREEHIKWIENGPIDKHIIMDEGESGGWGEAIWNTWKKEESLLQNSNWIKHISGHAL